MSISSSQVIQLRRERGWSQEKLAAISGLSERTIQRVEKDGKCSLDTKMALATAFEVSPTEFTPNACEPLQPVEYKVDWSGAFGLFIFGLSIPLVILLTGTHGLWEMASFFTVIGLSVIMSIMVYGAKRTYYLFDKTSWIVRYPSRAAGLNEMIVQAASLISNTYIIGCIASLVAALALAIHQPEMTTTIANFIPIVIKPLVYAVLFSEFWFRPYKRKMESMLTTQLESQQH